MKVLIVNRSSQSLNLITKSIWDPYHIVRDLDCLFSVNQTACEIQVQFHDRFVNSLRWSWEIKRAKPNEIPIPSFDRPIIPTGPGRRRTKRLVIPVPQSVTDPRLTRLISSIFPLLRKKNKYDLLSRVQGTDWPSWPSSSSPVSTIDTSYFIHIFYFWRIPHTGPRLIWAYSVRIRQSLAIQLHHHPSSQESTG